MKVILTGSTGHIGGEVLTQCLTNPSITSIVSLQRRELPGAIVNPKLSTIIMEDFMVYPDSVLDQLRDADAVIWSLGTYNWDKVVEVDYPAAFQNALIKATNGTRPVNYVYLGGAFTEPDQQKTLWFLSEGRHIRGLAQANLLGFAKEHEGVKPYVVRPAGVLKGNGSALLGYLLGTISVRRLAAVMVDLAVNGGPEEVIPNQVLISRSGKLLEQQKA